MALYKNIPNYLPYTLTSKFSVKVCGTTIVPPKDNTAPEFCLCECPYAQYVFHSDDGLFWKNDKTSVLFKKYLPSDTIEIQLWKDGVQKDVLNSSVYGEYFNITSKDYIGYVVDWKKVFDAFGNGGYQIKAAQIILGQSTPWESVEYNLFPYNSVLANGTVRIETTQNGNIMSSDFDFTGLNWYSSYRISGRFRVEESIEIDRYLTSAYRYDQIQDVIPEKYTLETKLLPSAVTKVLIKDSLLANDFLITSYHELDHDKYIRVPVYPSAIPAQGQPSQTSKKKYTIEFDNRFNIARKRNF